jgi:GTPase SAR1 family protein
MQAILVAEKVVYYCGTLQILLQTHVRIISPFNMIDMATIGVDYSIKTETRHNKLCKIQVWDTA